MDLDDTNLSIDRLIIFLSVFQLVVHWTLVEGVTRQFEAFKEGFESVFSLSNILCFYPEEVSRTLSTLTIGFP